MVDKLWTGPPVGLKRESASQITLNHRRLASCHRKISHFISSAAESLTRSVPPCFEEEGNEAERGPGKVREIGRGGSSMLNNRI